MEEHVEYTTTAYFDDSVPHDQNGQDNNEGLQIRLKPGEERIQGMRMGIFRKAQSMDIDAMARFVAHFMTDKNGAYLPEDVALELVDELTLEQLGDTMQALSDMIQEDAAPKAPGKQSTKLRISRG